MDHRQDLKRMLMETVEEYGQTRLWEAEGITVAGSADNALKKVEEVLEMVLDHIP